MRWFNSLLVATILLSAPMLAQSVANTNPSIAPSQTLRKPNAAAQAHINESYGKLPLSFEANQGQADAQVKFLSRAGGYSLFLTADEAVLSLYAETEAYARKNSSRRNAAAKTSAGSVLRMKLRNANAAAKVTGLDEQAGKSNYFIGNDPAKWRTNVATYEKVKYEGIYSGIDVVYYGNQRQLEYDFIVAPGADPQRIAFDVSGAKSIRQNAQGDLVFKMNDEEIRWHKPVVYQEKDGARQLVSARYMVTDENRVAFDLGKYDARRTLYIDPLIYSTYLGGSGNDHGFGIALDSAGNAYVVGQTFSSNFPTKDPLQASNGSAIYGTAFLTKINAAGSAFVYSTYLGGNGGDYGDAIAVDSSGNVYITGYTQSTNFPTTSGVFQPVCANKCSHQDAFVAKINSAGSALVYSTYLGGSSDDAGAAVAVDSDGNAYVAGVTQSTNFPTKNPFQSKLAGYYNAFLSKINPSGSALLYSTYLGGSNDDLAQGVAIDSNGNAYVTGTTRSTDFPTKNPLQGSNAGGSDAFITKFDSTGSDLVYSTYYGTPQEDDGYAIAADNSGNAYVAGVNYTNFCNFNTCFYYGYVSKLNPMGSAFVYQSTVSKTYTCATGIALDSSGSAFVIGGVGGDNFTEASCAQSTRAFVEKLDPSGLLVGPLVYLNGGGSVGAGIATDGLDNAFVTGTTGGTAFPTKNPIQAANAGGTDAFVAKIDMRIITTVTLAASPNPSTSGQAVTFTAVVSSSSGAPPDGETVSFVKGKTTLGTGTLSGGKASFTTSTLPVGTSVIQAVYGGDASFTGGKSKTLKQVVNQ